MTAERIRVMVSSRCEDRIRAAGAKASVKLTELRGLIKMDIEAMKLFGLPTFDCWIHEDAPALPGDVDAWGNCMRQVMRCHILIVLYNRNAGFAGDGSEVGICHAEMMTAVNTAPGKIRVIDLVKANVGRVNGDRRRNELFATYVAEQGFAVRFAGDADEVRARVKEAVQDAVIDLVDRGAGAARDTRYASGSSLDWSRFDYVRRKQAIESVLVDALGGSTGPGGSAAYQIGETRVYFRCHAIPAAMSIPAAREMVGRPFLRDHECLSQMQPDIAGPVHVIGCHRAVTENQAITLLGFPDATVVKPEFGIYVADNVQKIQLVFLSNCRDETSTRVAVDRFRAWLRRTGENQYLVERAKGRKAIASVIARQGRS